MADAGRRLVPDGARDRPEDVPRLEAYFQEVCAREPRFLLWRKSSYPGAAPRPPTKRRARGGSVRARDPADVPPRPLDLLGHTSGGRLDLAKLRRDFFLAPPPAPPPVVSTPPDEDDETCLVDLLRKYLKLEEDSGPTRPTESDELVKALRRYLGRRSDEVARRPAGEQDTTQRTLLENLGRYYSRSANRDHIVQDLLTDRNLLKRLYHDLRKTKPYRGGRSGGGPGPFVSGAGAVGRGAPRPRPTCLPRPLDPDVGAGSSRHSPRSPPPLIEVRDESPETQVIERGTQTDPVSEEVLAECERAAREPVEEERSATAPTSPTGRRRSSVDHDDVSQSVSDTIKRYLRMARKKSVDADKADQFKRINYDKNLRNIKPRAPGNFDDDGPNKGCQTEKSWTVGYRASRRGQASSPVSPTQPQSFLSSLLGRGPTTTLSTPAGSMRKSRSSGSVVHSVSKRLWRGRSSSRAATWTPQVSGVLSENSYSRP